MYGDDYTSINLAHNYSSSKYLSLFLYPFANDYFSSNKWVVERPVNYAVFKYIYILFGGEPFPFYLFRIITISILAVLTYLLLIRLLKSEKKELFALYSVLFIFTLTPFFYSNMCIKEVWALTYIFIIISFILLIKAMLLRNNTYLILSLLLMYISIKTKTDGKLLAATFIVFFIINYKKIFIDRKLLILYIIFMLLLIIPLKNPFNLGYVGYESHELIKSKPILDQINNVLFKQSFEKPYGIEESLAIFDLPFPFYQPLIPRFSILGSFGFFIGWFLIIVCLLFLYRFRTTSFDKFKTTIVSFLESLTFLVVIWSATAIIAIILTFSRSPNPVELPGRIITAQFPFSILLFILIDMCYCSLKNKRKLFLYILSFVLVATLLTNIFFMFRITSIEGEQSYLYNEAIKAASLNKYNISGKDFDVLKIHDDGKHYSEIVNQTAFEHYNFVIHPVITGGALESLKKSNRTFYLVDSVNYAYFNISMLPSNANYQLIYNISQPNRGLFWNVKSIIKHAFKSNKELSIAYVYVVEPVKKELQKYF